MEPRHPVRNVVAAFTGLARQWRWSYAPPMLVYFAAGLSGLSSIVGAFFVKEYLDLSAAFLAGLGFWAGLPWTLKMPLGHLVDLIWKWKAGLVYLGAALIAASLAIMYGLIAHTDAMRLILPVEVWFVISTLLSPIGYVVQDVVADAMTVEAVPTYGPDGSALPDAEIKTRHTTMQTLGRIAIISGLMIVSALNIFMFQGVEAMDQATKVGIYADIYLIALAVPLISVAGVILNTVMLRRARASLRAEGVEEAKITALLVPTGEAPPKPNWWILGGALVYAVFTSIMGVSGSAYAQEIVFAGSLGIVLFLISRITRELPRAKALALIGTATIIFVFRAVPLPGPGQTWFEIDRLGFDQQFLAVLSLITSGLALVGMVLLRPLMATWSIAAITVLLTVAGGILMLPTIGLYYGVQDWTAAWTGGIVDARFIAVLNTAIESPLGQVAMIPMLAWIAKNAPANLKATFFAVMASFTNLALSASSLGTKYLNEIYTVTREVKSRDTGAVEVPADYSELGLLLMTVAAIMVIVPLLTIFVVQSSRFRTTE